MCRVCSTAARHTWTARWGVTGTRKDTIVLAIHGGSTPLRGTSLNPTPSTLNPQPSTLNPQPSTLNPQPSNLNPEPRTLNPEPSGTPVRRAGRRGGADWEKQHRPPQPWRAPGRPLPSSEGTPRSNILNMFEDVRTENGSSHGQNVALTGLCVPSLLEIGT